MKEIKLAEDSIFSIQKISLMGKVIEGETTSSYDFIRSGSKLLEANTSSDSFSHYIWEYSAILKELVKSEMLEEMRRRIDNIDTFYR